MTEMYNIVEICEAYLEIQVHEDGVHKPLEGGWRITQAKGHFWKPEGAAVADESRFVHVLRVYLDLVESRSEAKVLNQLDPDKVSRQRSMRWS